MNYLDEIAIQIRLATPTDVIPKGDVMALFRMYGVLLLAKGVQVNSEDVHNAWVAWMLAKNSGHPALNPFSELPPEKSKLDSIYVSAIHEVATLRERELHSKGGLEKL